MELPSVTVTMLGASGSGKSTFMLGMYADLSAGRQGYFAHARQDDHVDLMNAWDRLNEDGELPKPTDAEIRQYRFVFNRGVQPLLEIDWLDYRGGAIGDRTTAKDTQSLLQRITKSDSLYLVLDGRALGEWVRALIDERAGGTRAPTLARIRRSLRVEDMTRLLNDAIAARRDVALPAPSVTIVITKQDTLEPLTRIPRRDALGIIVGQLPELLPVAFAPGITTLVNPVQLGDFGAEQAEHVDVSAVRPEGFETPFVFSFAEYLSTQITTTGFFLETVARQEADTDQQIATLQRALGGLFHRGRIRQLTQAQADRVAEVRRLREQLAQMQARAGQLFGELHDRLIIRDGKMPD